MKCKYHEIVTEFNESKTEAKLFADGEQVGSIYFSFEENEAILDYLDYSNFDYNRTDLTAIAYALEVVELEHKT